MAESSRAWPPALRRLATAFSASAAMPFTLVYSACDNEVAEGINGRGFKRVDLLGHTHGADLGADAGANSA